MAKTLEGNPIITNVHYDESKKQWTLRYQNYTGTGERLISMIIEDTEPMTIGQPIYEQPPYAGFVTDDEMYVDLSLQHYNWTYTDVISRQEKQIEHKTPLSHLLPSFDEAVTLTKPETMKLVVDDLEVIHKDITLLDENMNEVVKIVDEHDVFPTGTYYMLVTIEFEQGTSIYVNTVRFN